MATTKKTSKKAAVKVNTNKNGKKADKSGLMLRFDGEVSLVETDKKGKEKVEVLDSLLVLKVLEKIISDSVRYYFSNDTGMDKFMEAFGEKATEAKSAEESREILDGVLEGWEEELKAKPRAVRKKTKDTIRRAFDRVTTARQGKSNADLDRDGED